MPLNVARTLAALACGALATLTVSCGVSIQAVYEGNVRFEHCMALDDRPDVKPTLRRSCWDEWIKFYTYGQTRDRVEHARVRRQQLVGASDFDEGDWTASKHAEQAVPEPTSAAAPPPMMLVSDGGSTPDASLLTAAPEDKAQVNAECTAACDEASTLCQKDCKSATCAKSCQGTFKRCVKKCQ